MIGCWIFSNAILHLLMYHFSSLVYGCDTLFSNLNNLCVPGINSQLIMTYNFLYMLLD